MSQEQRQDTNQVTRTEYEDEVPSRRKSGAVIRRRATVCCFKQTRDVHLVVWVDPLFLLIQAPIGPTVMQTSPLCIYTGTPTDALWAPLWNPRRALPSYKRCTVWSLVAFNDCVLISPAYFYSNPHIFLKYINPHIFKNIKKYIHISHTKYKPHCSAGV